MRLVDGSLLVLVDGAVVFSLGVGVGGGSLSLHAIVRLKLVTRLLRRRVLLVVLVKTAVELNRRDEVSDDFVLVGRGRLRRDVVLAEGREVLADDDGQSYLLGFVVDEIVEP